MDDVSKLVARQYTQYAYPEPFPDIEQWLAKGFLNLSDPRYFSASFWPEGPPRQDLKILVAGCGTVQAAVLAYTNRGSTVIGVDLSEPSLAHERYLQDRHGLNNLHLYKGDLRHVGKLGEAFDLIVCTGVLHHMQKPEEGLAALSSVLGPRGVMFLMVYGLVRRLGVYLLQDAFRRLGIQQDEAGVQLVKDTLRKLNPNHFVHVYAQSAHDLVHDAGFVDTFLHPQDRAYTVPDVLDFVEQAGLAFQGWADNFYYYRDGHPELEGLATRLDALPIREQWAVVEKLTLDIGKHTFLTRRVSCNPASYVVDFSGVDWLNYRPARHPLLRVTEKATVAPEKPAKFERGRYQIELPPAEALLVGESNGERSIVEMLRHPLLAKHPSDKLSDFARKFFARMWRLGHMYFPRSVVGRAD